MCNPYDDNAFFAAYASMERSQGGLPAAGEWGLLRAMFPDLRGKAVLDLGCGYGWHCKYAAQQGASLVLGIDLSHKMIQTAREKNPHPAIQYRVCGLEAYAYPPNGFDLVLSNLALHYVEDLEAVYRNVFKTLKPGGCFLLNIEHPVFTAGVRQDWAYGADGKPLYWPVDQYYIPGPRQTLFLGHPVVKQHHTLTQILNPLLEMGFQLEAVQEAQPPAQMLCLPGMQDELRRPMMLLVKARKPG